MKILHTYLFKNLLKNVFLASTSMIALFLVVDFFDRIDDILPKNVSFITVIRYFMLKVPQFFVLTLPVSFIIATLFTYGILSKNSEITAMRAAGLKLSWLSWPLLSSALVFSLINLLCSEFVVPDTVKRVKEIYNIDIKEKDKEGIYSQKDLWWRNGRDFYSAEIFDSRDSALMTFSDYEINKDFQVISRIDSPKVKWLNLNLGWNMENVTKYKFGDRKAVELTYLRSLPLPIAEDPAHFYHRQTEPLAMSFFELKDFIQQQHEYGQSGTSLLADLAAKVSFPFVVFICALVVFPLSIRPARTGSMASSFIFGILLCFVYYALHSFSLALGRAELLSPILSAWAANLILLAVGGVLFLGVEAPE